MFLVYRIGLIEYEIACRLQKYLYHKRLDEKIHDVLLLLEHPPTLTIGKSGRLENILVSANQLRQNGVSLFSTERGGDVTYHGPGQLVAYPIISLTQRGRDVHAYVYDLEEVVISTLKDFSINAERDKSHAGVWIQNEEVAAIGLHIRKWVTMHGFALNVNPDLKNFSLINPCGFSDRQATSMSRILGRSISMEAVIDRIIVHFSNVFNTPVKSGSITALKAFL